MANITRYLFEDLLSDFGKGFWLRPFPLAAATADVKMKLDVKEDEKAYTVNDEIPGVKKDGVLNLVLPKKAGRNGQRISVA